MKKELRQRALAARNALEKREEKSRQIAAHILESAAYQNTERIFTFVSMGSEVETEEIRMGKLLPCRKRRSKEKCSFMKSDPLRSFRRGVSA